MIWISCVHLGFKLDLYKELVKISVFSPLYCIIGQVVKKCRTFLIDLRISTLILFVIKNSIILNCFPNPRSYSRGPLTRDYMSILYKLMHASRRHEDLKRSPAFGGMSSTFQSVGQRSYWKLNGVWKPLLTPFFVLNSHCIGMYGAFG